MQLLFDEMQITHPQWIVLHHVEKSRITNIKYLADALMITSSAATQIVDGLVKKGLQQRVNRHAVARPNVGVIGLSQLAGIVHIGVLVRSG